MPRSLSFEYDGNSRLSKTVSQLGDSAPFSADALNYVHTTTYQAAKPAIIEVDLYQGVEIGRRYKAFYGADRAEMHEEECTQPGAAWNAASNLVTITKSAPGRGGFPEPVSVLRPDGTMTLTAFSRDASGQLQTVVSEGEPNAGGTAIVNGRRTTTLLNVAESEIYRLEEALVAGAALQLGHDTRTFQRPDGAPLISELGSTRTTLTYEDNSTDVTERGCCGPLTHTDRLGSVTTYTYDDAGRQSTETRAGITITTVYDAEGRIASTTRTGTDNSSSVLATSQYDLAGRLVQTTAPPVNNAAAPARSTTSYLETTVAGHLVRTAAFPDGTTRLETYYQDGRPLSTTGSAVYPVQFDYGATVLARGGVNVNCTWTKETKLDAAGQPTLQWTKSYQDGRGRTVRVESPREVAVGGLATADSYYYDQPAPAGSVGRLAKSVDPDGVTMLYSYNAQGEPDLTALDMNANGAIDLAGPDRVSRTTHTYGTRGAVVGDRTTTTIYQTTADATATEAGVQEVSPDGRLAWSKRFGLETSIATTWTGGGATTTVTTLPDLSTLTETTANGRSASSTRKAGDGTVLLQQSMAYDPQGRLQTSTDVRNGATDYTYYTDDRVQTVTTPAADAQTAREVTSYTYGAIGQKATETLPDNAVVNYTYWPTGELRRQWGARAYPIEYGYDAQGRTATLTTWQDFAGQTGAAVTTWNYDAASGRLLAKKYADNKGPSYTYTPAGRLLTRTWQRGIVTTYGYDPNSGNPSGTTYSDATPAVGILRDRAGRPWQVTDAAGTRTLTYTPEGQLDLEDFGQAGMFAGVKIDPGYDALQRRTSLGVLQGAASIYAVGFTPDSASRLGTVTFGTETATYGYEPQAGNVVHQINFQHAGVPNLITTKSYDKLLRLTNINTAPAGGQSPPLSSFTYLYNAANQRTRATLEDSSYWSYGYDALGQVTGGAKYLADNTPALGRQFGYAYDDIGNRKSTAVNGRTASYTPNLLNQYLARQIPPAIDVTGEAAPDATVTVNQQPTARQGRTSIKLSRPTTARPIFPDRSKSLV